MQTQIYSNYTNTRIYNPINSGLCFCFSQNLILTTKPKQWLPGLKHYSLPVSNYNLRSKSNVSHVLVIPVLHSYILSTHCDALCCLMCVFTLYFTLCQESQMKKNLEPWPDNYMIYVYLFISFEICEWLFVSICQPCDELATFPGCPPPSPYEAGIGSSPSSWPLTG